MTIWTDYRRRQSHLGEYRSTVGEALGVAAEEAWLYSGVSAVGRFQELSEAKYGRQPLEIPELGLGPVQGPDSPVIAAEEARSRIADAELDLSVPDDGIPERALEILIDRKRAEQQRRDIQNRRPASAWLTAAEFGVGLGVSMFDPLNVAASFIPAVGPARYALMLERAGSRAARAGVRARVGAVEGAAGAAAIEPIVLAATSQEQADYDLTDSLLNIAFGTALGGGLHVGTGAVRDAFRNGRPTWRTAQAVDEVSRVIAEAPPAVREAALRVAVAQKATGRQVHVARIIRGRDGTPDRVVHQMRINRETGAVEPLVPEGVTLRTRPETEAAAVPVRQQEFAELAAEARQNFEPEEMEGADAAAADAVDARPAARSDEITTPAEVAVEVEDAKRLAESFKDVEPIAQDLEEIDAIEPRAQAYGEAIRAAASCLTRRGA